MQMNLEKDDRITIWLALMKYRQYQDFKERDEYETNPARYKARITKLAKRFEKSLYLKME